MDVRRLVVGSAAVLALIASFEGTELTPYKDVGGIPTVCNGHTGDDVEDRPYKPEECAALLRNDVEEHAIGVMGCITTPISQGELDAYTSWAFNVGVEAACGSSLIRKLNAGDRVGACNELLRWNKAAGKISRGLTRRRQAERDLCLRGIP